MKRTINTVLIVCNYSSKYGGNFVASLRSLALFAASKNKKVIFCFPCLAKEKEWVKWLSSDFEIFFFNNLKDVVSITKDNNIDCLYTHFLSIRHISYLKFKTNIPVVAHIHSDFSNGNKTTIKDKIKFLISYFLTFGIKFILVSKHFKNIPHKKRQFIILNALTIDREKNKGTKTSLTKQDFGFASSDIVIELFGWSPYTKGVDIALNAFSQVSHQPNNKLKLLIVTDESNKTISYIKENNLDCYSVILDNPRNNVFEFHNIADVFLSSSRSEGFSYAALEALSLGKPCILSDIDGVSWAKNYANTHFFPYEDVQELSILFGQINNNELDIHVNGNLSQKIIKDFSIDEWCAKIYRIVYEDSKE